MTNPSYCRINTTDFSAMFFCFNERNYSGNMICSQPSGTIRSHQRQSYLAYTVLALLSVSFVLAAGSFAVAGHCKPLSTLPGAGHKSLNCAYNRLVPCERHKE
ncbi:unnamed protein product [Parajaminaea phylloscopi]